MVACLLAPADNFKKEEIILWRSHKVQFVPDGASNTSSLSTNAVKRKGRSIIVGGILGCTAEILSVRLDLYE